MAFEPTAWKIYRPECGQRKIGKSADGSFVCSECGCEFRHNWRAWIIVGTPSCVLALVVMLMAASVNVNGSVPSNVVIGGWRR
jgi:hypothetical protein